MEKRLNIFSKTSLLENNYEFHLLETFRTTRKTFKFVKTGTP